MSDYQLRAIPPASPLRRSASVGRDFAYGIFHTDGRCVFRAERHHLLFLTETIRNLRATEIKAAA